MAGPLRPEGLRILCHLRSRVIPARPCHVLAASAPRFEMSARLLSLHICIEFWDNILQAVDDSRGKAGFSIYGPRGRRTSAATDACIAWNNTSPNQRLDPFHFFFRQEGLTCAQESHTTQMDEREGLRREDVTHQTILSPRQLPTSIVGCQPCALPAYHLNLRRDSLCPSLHGDGQHPPPIPRTRKHWSNKYRRCMSECGHL